MSRIPSDCGIAPRMQGKETQWRIQLAQFCILYNQYYVFFRESQQIFSTIHMIQHVTKQDIELIESHNLRKISWLIESVLRSVWTYPWAKTQHSIHVWPFPTCHSPESNPNRTTKRSLIYHFLCRPEVVRRLRPRRKLQMKAFSGRLGQEWRSVEVFHL